MNGNSDILIKIHQIPKSPFKFILLTFQHVFAMFGANILVPILINQSAGMEVIPLQVAFLCSGVGTLLYLFITGFRTPIYLGSSFAFLGGMTTLYATSGQITGGFNIFFALMIVGLVYVFLSMFLYFSKKVSKIKNVLSPVIIGPAIIIIGWGLIANAAKDAFFNVSDIEVTSQNIGSIWAMIAISVVTLAIIIISMVFLKGFWKMIPFLLGMIFGTLFALIVYGIAKGVNDTNITSLLFDKDTNQGVAMLLQPSSWKWYPDITLMWKTNVQNHTPFNIGVYLSLVPIAIVTISEHIGDHINIGHITGNDFIENKPGLYRTLLGDGIATIVSATFGGPANTSYGENTSVISITKVASIWVIFSAAIVSIIISFIAPISILLNAIPKPVTGAIGIILYTMIGINGLKLMIQSKVNMFEPKNIVLVAIIVVCGLGGTIFIFLPSDIIGSQIALSGTGIGILIAIVLNIILPSKNENESIEDIPTINLSPTDFIKKTKSFINKKRKKKI